MLFVGVDGEMSHNNVEEGGALIQLGVAVRSSDGDLLRFDTVMKPDFDYAWDDVAENVHGYSRAEVDSWDVCYGDADLALYDWLVSVGCRPSKRRDTVGVGFSVGSFDMVFVKKFLPKTFSLFSRRFLDLNSLVYLLSAKTGVSFTDVKQDVMSEVVERIGYDDAHDAGWDAVMHVVFWETIQSRLNVV